MIESKNRVFDFVLVMEVKDREFETNCLLCYELIKRGYTVKLLSTWDEAFFRHAPLKTKVVVSWSMYNTRTFNNIAGYVDGCSKMINMQCEQILTNSAAEAVSDEIFAGVHGKAKEVVHLSWGENTKRRMIEKYQVKPENIFLTGDIALDLYRPMFASLTMSRSEICKKYEIPVDKKIYLFISSFTINDLPENTFNDLGLDERDARFKIVAIKSQKEILNWFAKILNQFDNGILIYRPHPAERDNLLLHEFEYRYKNFRVIADDSIRHWIAASDKIYTWISTSVKEIYAAHKTCDILRPYPIEWDNEMQIYNEAKFITSYEEFEKTFFEYSNFPISKSIMQDFIYIPDIPTYKLVADCFEKVLKDNLYAIHFNSFSKIARWKKRIFINFKMKVYKILYVFLKNRQNLVPAKIGDKMDNYAYAVEMRKKNHFTKEEYNQLLLKYESIFTRE